MKTPLKNLTDHARARKLIEGAQQQICERLGFTRDELSQMMYEQGIIFLEEYHKHAPLMQRLMEGDTIFWNWWRNQWHYRNEEFLKDPEMPYCSLAMQRLAYIGFNSGKELVAIIRPTRVVYLRLLNTYKKAL